MKARVFDLRASRVVVLLALASCEVTTCGEPDGSVALTPVYADDKVVAVAVDAAYENVLRANVRISANGPIMRDAAGATTALCRDVAKSSATFHLLPVGETFDGAARLHAELFEGTCGGDGAFIADAVYPVDEPAEAATTAGGTASESSSTTSSAGGTAGDGQGGSGGSGGSAGASSAGSTAQAGGT